jgi:hypothetical protein
MEGVHVGDVERHRALTNVYMLLIAVACRDRVPRADAATPDDAIDAAVGQMVERLFGGETEP